MSADPVRDRLASVLAPGAATVAVAESLTGGELAAALAAMPHAARWFRGGIVAYSPEVKHRLLDVPEGPVVSAVAAEEMARSACRLLDAEVAVAVTGVGGPGSEDGRPPGDVFVAVHDGRTIRSEELHLDGDPRQVVSSTIDVALDRLLDALDRRSPR